MPDLSVSYSTAAVYAPGRSGRTVWEQAKDRWALWFVAFLTCAWGVLALLHLFPEQLPGPTRFWAILAPYGPSDKTFVFDLAWGLGLAYLSLHLVSRKRAAWWAATGLFMALAFAHLLRGPRSVDILTPAVVVALLLVCRDRFTVRGEPGSAARGLALTGGGLGIALAFGVMGFVLLGQRAFGDAFSVRDGVVMSLQQVSLVDHAEASAQSQYGALFLVSLQAMGFLAVAAGLHSVFRPRAFPVQHPAQDRARARALVEGYGRSSLDYFKLRDDKSYFFSENRRACIAYRMQWGVAVSLGDPVGAEEELAETTRSFMESCAESGKSAAFLHVTPELLPLYRRLGLQALKIGQEAVIDLERFATQTSSKKYLRYVRRKFESAEYSFERCAAPHPKALLDEAEEVSDQWLTLAGRQERSFIVGRFDRDYLNKTTLWTLRNAGGLLVAFVNEVPSYSRGEATVDLIRHRAELVNGTIDFLFTRLMLALRRQGYKRFNMGLAPFAGIGGRKGASLEERALSLATRRLHLFSSYNGLWQFKSKFEPVWEDRFLVYEGGTPGLVKAGFALARVTAG